MKATEMIYIDRLDLSVNIAVDFDDVKQAYELTIEGGEWYLTEKELNQISNLINKMKKVHKTRQIP